MARPKVIWAILVVVAAIVVALASFRYGVHVQRTEESRSLAYTQAMLAFAHHKFYEGIESLLMRKCYEAALTEARELKNLQVSLVSENLRETGNDPGLMEYIKVRNPNLLEAVVAGRVPERKAYTTTCP